MAAVRTAPRGRPSTHDAPPSLWASAAAAGAGTAVLAASVAVVVVAIVWLPASGASGSAGSTLRAGALTFLAGLHAGITVDGIDTAFVPLGLTCLVARLTWRSGSALAAAADETDERRPGRLLAIGGVQAAAFAIVCAVLAGIGTLGTSSVSVGGAAVAGFVLCALTGGAALARGTALADVVADTVAPWIARSVWAAAVALVVYLTAGAVLVAASVAMHHGRVTQLSGEVGGGWSGVPVLLLGVLAAPNAVIAAAGYLSGAGFAVGGGTTVGLGTTSHGIVPAFPILGALPDGTGSTTPAWLLAVVTALVAGGCVAVICRRGSTGCDQWRDAAGAVLGAAAGSAVLAWLGGGAIGTGRLATVGVSPWQFPLFLVVVVGAVAAAVLGVFTAVDSMRVNDVGAGGVVRSTLAAVRDAAAGSGDTDDRIDDGTDDRIDDDTDDRSEDDEDRDDRRGTRHRGGGGKLAG